MFNGILGQWQRLSDKMITQVSLCISRYGRQSIDMVFEQVRHEQLYMNKNGFVPNFDFIFTLKQYGIYLERAQLRQQKKDVPQPQQSVGVISEQVEVQGKMPKEQYEKMMREAAAKGNKYVIKIVEQWNKKEETV